MDFDGDLQAEKAAMAYFYPQTRHLYGLPFVDLLSRITNRKAAAARPLFFCLWRRAVTGINQTKGT